MLCSGSSEHWQSAPCHPLGVHVAVKPGLEVKVSQQKVNLALPKRSACIHEAHQLVRTAEDISTKCKIK
eukprot:6181437-Pleurochrysis_carterae.AAC.2